MNLYVVRHGQVPSNIEKIIAGCSDEELTEKGLEQARYIHDELKDIDFKVVYCSPVRRAVQTAEIVAPNKDVVYDERLIERNPGRLIGHSRKDINKADWNSLSKEVTDDGAETLLAGLKRTKEFLTDLFENCDGGDNILIITHNFISRCIWMIINDITDVDEINAYFHKNDEIKMYTVKHNKKFVKKRDDLGAE